MIIATKSRADYFKERRKKEKNFSASLPKEKVEKMENILKQKNLTKREWLEKQVDEEISKFR